MSWDWVISFAIIVALILTIWAKVSRQTIGELMGDIKDKLTDKGEDVVDMGVDIYE